MVQTQLASMYLGNPMSLDAEDRLSGVSSQLDATIHILDGQSNQGIILDYITAKNIISDTHKKSLEDTLETYTFITFADKRFSQYLEKRNRFIIPDEDGTLQEFVMFEGAKYKDNEGHKAQVHAHASYLELKKATVLYPDSFKGTASQHAGRTLDDTGWQVGIVEVAGNKTLSRDKHTNPYEFLKHIAQEFDAELKFRVEHNGNKIVGRYVDLLERVGEWRGREVEFGKDLDGIRRVEKQNIVTALLGLGPEREDGSRIEVLVEDEDALQRWGWEDEHGNLNHWIQVHEIQSEREEMTMAEARRYTRTALDKRINESVKYECTIIDLENVPGMQNKKIRHGDTIRIKDTHFNPPLYLEARVFEFDRSIKSRAKKNIKLGDFTEFTEEEVNAMWTLLQREIRKKIDIDTLQEYAEPKKIESDTPPPIKDGENPIWVDTSKTPKVSNVVIGGEWQKMSPTTAAEVDAYNKQQADKKNKDTLDSAKQDATTKANNAQTEAERKAAEDALRKAEQALADAKAFAKNASNIEDGIVDVGAVPLRTSKTGARLEWDGVNGLVQYDSQGNAVAWIDLDANAHFANAFLSGRIEALEGYFGKNERVTIGDDGLTIKRPDGAVSMEDGLLHQNYSVSSFEPHRMTQAHFSSGGNSSRFSMFIEEASFYRGGAYEIVGKESYVDNRDSSKGWSVRFTTYEFVHAARYLVIGYRKASNASNMKHRTLIYDGDEEIYSETHERGGSPTYAPIIIDLGTPTFEVKTLELRIGANKGDATDINDFVGFRFNRIFLTDFLD